MSGSRYKTKEQQKKLADKGIGGLADSSNQVAIPKSKLHAGSITNKIPVIIDERTIIYVNPGSDEAEVRLNYERNRSIKTR